MTVGQRIAQKRKELGLSQEGLGERLGVSRQAIYKWESDAALPEIEKLVNLSREFSVSIDWLLGEEEARPELTVEQLRMVEEIVGRYLDARPPEHTVILRETVGPEAGGEKAPEPKPPKRRRWPKVLAALGAAALAAVLVNLFAQLEQTRQDYQNLQYSISNVTQNVNNQIGGIAGRVESILQSQNTLTAEQSAQVVSTDYRANTVTIEVRALPRTYVEGMAVEFLLDSGGRTATVPGALGEDHAFTARATVPLTDEITVSAALLTGDQRQTQMVERFDGMYTQSFPGLNIGNGLWGWGGKVEEYVWVDSVGGFGEARAAASSIKVGLFRDQKLLVWYEPVEGIPPNYNGFDQRDTRFFRLEGDWVLEADHVYCIVALVTDEYGRERMYPDTAVKYDPEQDLAEQYAENGVVTFPSTDPADWEY